MTHIFAKCVFQNFCVYVILRLYAITWYILPLLNFVSSRIIIQSVFHLNTTPLCLKNCLWLESWTWCIKHKSPALHSYLSASANWGGGSRYKLLGLGSPEWGLEPKYVAYDLICSWSTLVVVVGGWTTVSLPSVAALQQFKISRLFRQKFCYLLVDRVAQSV